MSTVELAVSAPIDLQGELVRHARWLRTVILARLGEPQAVDEVFQDVAVATLRNTAKEIPPGNATAWLYRVAVVQSLLYRRKAGRRRKLNERYREAAAPQTNETNRNSLHWLMLDEQKEALRGALRDLPARDRELLLLKYTENWTYKQIADHLGLAVPNVETRLHRARKKLRARLESHGSVGVMK